MKMFFFKGLFINNSHCSPINEKKHKNLNFWVNLNKNKFELPSNFNQQTNYNFKGCYWI